MALPTLYTFRRCPYAIRARLAVAVSGVAVTEIEVKLSDKPASMLALSPKGTVPVLRLTAGGVIDESLDIMDWALSQNDPAHWGAVDRDAANALITINDSTFKSALDRYKYPERYPEFPTIHYRDVEAAPFLQTLELQLSQRPYLLGEHSSIADAAIFPFIRQFVAVDAGWFGASEYRQLKRWHDDWLASDLFQRVMKKT
jgi:glutathione S-transferase